MPVTSLTPWQFSGLVRVRVGPAGLPPGRADVPPSTAREPPGAMAWPRRNGKHAFRAAVTAVYEHRRKDFKLCRNPSWWQATGAGADLGELTLP